MNGEEPARTNVTPAPDTRLQSNGVRRSTSFLLRLSKGLGSRATQPFVEVKGLWNRHGTSALSAKNNDVANSNETKKDLQKNQNEVEEGGTKLLDNTDKLHRAIEQSHEVLASANTVFPLTLFPDTVTVDRTKVTITRRNFFWSADVLSIRIEDVLNVAATCGPLFGTLTLASRVMSTTDHFAMQHLWRNDAMHLKHIIQGYVIAQHNDIDVAHLDKDELINTLIELGYDANS